MNLNELARKITLAEGKKVSLTIAQVKEVIRLVLAELDTLSTFEIISLMNRTRKRAKK